MSVFAALTEPERQGGDEQTKRPDLRVVGDDHHDIPADPYAGDLYDPWAHRDESITLSTDLAVQEDDFVDQTARSAPPAAMPGPEDTVEALRGLIQRTPNCAPGAYRAAFLATGMPALDDWAIAYLRKRAVAPTIAAAPAADRTRYFTGVGALPTPPSGCGSWTQKQQEWAVADGGRAWMIIQWLNGEGDVIGWQNRWQFPRREATEYNSSGAVSAWDEHKFDFPAQRDRAVNDRLIDACHARTGTNLVIIIESPVRGDSLASHLPARLQASVLAVGGISQSYEGKSNPSNPSDFLPRLSPDLLQHTGGVKGKHVLWCPDSDHDSNPACNDATQKTIESLLVAGAASVAVVDVPSTVSHPLSGRVESLGNGAGLDDLAAAMAEFRPGEQWLGPLLADAIPARHYIARYPKVPQNDVQGLAEVVADALARDGRFRFVQTSKADGLYHHYDGGYWGIDVADAAATIEAAGCASRVLDPGGKEATTKARAFARRNIDAAVKRAVKTRRGKADVLIREAEWEPRAWAEYVPTPSGLLDPAALAVLPHDPEAMNLGVTTVDWIPDARHAEWDDFVDSLCVTQQRDGRGEIITDGDGEPSWVLDPDKRRMLQEIAGAALLGRTYDTALFMVGAGGAGISTFVGALAGVLPAVYLGALTASELTGGDNQFVLSGVVNARLTEIGEFGPNDRLNEKLLKLLAQDGSQMPVEPKFGEKYNAHPRSTFISTTNHLPSVAGTAGLNNSLPRRICIAEFPRIVAKPDSGLQSRLATREAREAILAWAVEGAHRFLTSAERKPWRSPASIEAVKNWLSDHDRLGKFKDNCLVANPDAYVERGKAFAAYLAWCEDEHVAVRYRMDKSRFIEALSERKGFGSSEAGGNRRTVGGRQVRGWAGWELVEPADIA